MRYKTKPAPFLSLVNLTFYSLCQQLLAITILLVFFLNIPSWIDSQTGVRSAPLIYLGFILAPIIFVLRDRRDVFEVFYHPYIWWCSLVLLMHFSGFIRAEYFGGTVDETGIQIDRMEKFLIAPAAAYLVFSIPHKIFKPYLCALIIIIPLILIYGFIDPTFFHSRVKDTYNVLGRSGGTWFNPNIAGEAVLLGLIMARGWAPKILYIIAFCLAGVAVMATGSRAAMMGWLLLCLYCLRSGDLPKIFFALPVLLGVFYSSVLIFVEDLLESIPEHAAGADNLMSRLQFMAGDADLAEGGGDQRSIIVVSAMMEALERPFLGHGHDYADNMEVGAGSHNLIVQLWHMHGLLGLLVVGSLAYILYRYTTGHRFLNINMLAFAWFTLFTHNIFESNVWLMFFAMTIYEFKKSKRANLLQPTTHRDVIPGSEGNSRRGSRRSSSKKRRKYSW